MDDRTSGSVDTSGLLAISNELRSRPSRAPDFAAESAAYAAIARGIAATPDSAEQQLARWVRTLCRAQSAGICTLESSGLQETFRFSTAEGMFAANVGRVVRKDASPFDLAIHQRDVLFLTHVSDRLGELGSMEPPIRECLLAAILLDEHAVGVVWAFQHTPDAKFDAEDVRLLHNLAHFAAVALRSSWTSLARPKIDEEHRLATLLHNLRDYAIFMLDANGKISEWTEGARRVLGYTPAEVLGQNFSMVFSPEDQQAGEPARELAEAERTGRVERDAWRVHLTGRRIWMNVILNAIRDEDGRLVGFTKISRDLTEKRVIEQEREELKARLADELEHMVRLHDMSSRLMQSGDLSLVLKEVLEAILDLQHAERGNVQLYDAKEDSLMIVAQRGLPAEFMERFSGTRVSDDLACAQAARTRERVIIEDLQAPGLPEVLRQVSKIGHCRAVQSSPILDDNGALVGVLSTHFRDPHRLSQRDARLTDAYLRLAAEVIVKVRYEQELRAAQRTAERANESKTRFLATASHDLRQPLQTLSLLNGSLRRMVANTDAARIAVEQQQAIAVISSLLNALLDISKLESGAVKPEIIDFDLQSLSEGVRAEFSALAQKKGLTFRILGGQFWVRSDPVLVAQIIRNLIGNAIRYTKQGWVEFRSTQTHDSVTVEVADSGIGIPEALIPNIFEEFYQVGVAPNSAREGHGLGLNIVQRTARLLGHPLEVRSELGKGSVFSLTVPKGRPIVGPAHVAEPPMEQHRGGRRRVLIVDDEASVLLATRLLLELEGYEILEATSLSQAKAVAKQNADIQLLVSDYHLANRELGTAVIDEVRKILKRHIGAVLMSGDTSKAMSQLALDERTRVARKPIEADELLGLLRFLRS
ncbi:MAG TPA: ATP-binding protein [Steroidobacteraceae bacterium]|nr:ATP-binding protein [Steroidobacteraceae bacterium]